MVVIHRCYKHGGIHEYVKDPHYENQCPVCFMDKLNSGGWENE